MSETIVAPGHSPATDQAPSEPARLRQGVITLPQAVAHSLTVIAPAMSGAFITYLVATKAGGATPLSYLLAMGACLVIAMVVREFAQRLPSAGSLYTYTAHGIGPFAGFMTGWGYTIGLILCSVGVLAGFGGFVSMAAAAWGFPGLLHEWWVWSLLGLVVYFALSYFNVSFSTRTAIVAVILTAGTLLLLAVIVIAKGGAEGNTLKAFSPGAAGVGFDNVLAGLAFGILSFTGFETAAVFGEETSNPRRDVPLAIFGAVLLGGVFYIIVTYATSIGYGVAEATTKWPESAGGLGALADGYASWIGNWVLLAGGTAALFCGLGLHNAITRMLFAMGREGMLPRVFGRSHPRYKTPHVAIVSYLAMIVVLGLIVLFSVSRETGIVVAGQDPATADWGEASAFYLFSETLTLGTPLIMAGYFVLAAAGLTFASRGRAGANRLRLVVASIGALVVAAVAVWSSLEGSFQAEAPGPIKLAPWLFLAVVVVGAVWGHWVRSRRPDAWRAMGTIFE